MALWSGSREKSRHFDGVPITAVYFCNCSMFCCTLLYVHSSIAIILMGKRELVAWLNMSSWCLVMVEWFFLAVQWDCLLVVIVVFPDHTHSLFCIVISIVCGVSCVFGLWFSMHCVVSLSTFAITSLRKKDLVALL